jgi:hypothetical protein
MFTVTDDLKSLNLPLLWENHSMRFQVRCSACKNQKSTVWCRRVIRVMLHAYVPEGTEVQHAYLGGTQSLRPDIMLHSWQFTHVVYNKQSHSKGESPMQRKAILLFALMFVLSISFVFASLLNSIKLMYCISRTNLKKLR